MKKEGDYWMWCARCQRCYMRSEVHRRARGGGGNCPAGCRGTVIIDGFRWDDVRALAPGVLYPRNPEAGVVYPVPEDCLHDLVA